MTPNNTFEFKPALLAKRKIFHVYEDRLEYVPKDKSIETIFYKDIKSSRFAVTTAREYRFFRLDLVKRDGELFRINITSGLTSTRKSDVDLAAFYDVVEAFAMKVSTARPDLKVTYGETPKVLWVWFILGVLTLAGVAAMLVLALMTRVSTDKLLASLMPMAMMGMIGIACISANPFRKKPAFGWDDFGKILREL